MRCVAYRMRRIPAEYSHSRDTRIAREEGGYEIGARPNFGDLLILAPRLPYMSHVRLVSVHHVGTLEIAHTHACHAYVYTYGTYCTPTSRYSRVTRSMILT